MTCPECGNCNPKKIFEESNKDNVIYYSMQGRPVYEKVCRCGDCGEIFKKNSD
jgi:uncharacterized cysteine cluster protein YcgN (CxxCxxCC family)